MTDKHRDGTWRTPVQEFMDALNEIRQTAQEDDSALRRKIDLRVLKLATDCLESLNAFLETLGVDMRYKLLHLTVDYSREPRELLEDLHRVDVSAYIKDLG